MSATATLPPPASERFQTREELDQYIEQKTSATLEKAVGNGQVRDQRKRRAAPPAQLAAFTTIVNRVVAL